MVPKGVTERMQGHRTRGRGDSVGGRGGKEAENQTGGSLLKMGTFWRQNHSNGGFWQIRGGNIGQKMDLRCGNDSCEPSPRGGAGEAEGSSSREYWRHAVFFPFSELIFELFYDSYDR